ncbi:MAG: hypothetical protein RIR86_2222 [Acidobacteriota bacterium]|jgi:hypothetical protein
MTLKLSMPVDFPSRRLKQGGTGGESIARDATPAPPPVQVP